MGAPAREPLLGAAACDADVEPGGPLACARPTSCWCRCRCHALAALSLSLVLAAALVAVVPRFLPVPKSVCAPNTALVCAGSPVACETVEATRDALQAALDTHAGEPLAVTLCAPSTVDFPVDMGVPVLLSTAGASAEILPPAAFPRVRSLVVNSTSTVRLACSSAAPAPGDGDRVAAKALCTLVGDAGPAGSVAGAARLLFVLAGNVSLVSLELRAPTGGALSVAAGGAVAATSCVFDGDVVFGGGAAGGAAWVAGSFSASNCSFYRAAAPSGGAVAVSDLGADVPSGPAGPLSPHARFVAQSDVCVACGARVAGRLSG